ncbi:sigma-54 interaction domain-containing protein [Aidingimonas lacisalsi]|uniref:sigma-54 interaction domain-containing protein n=1 Tax=Aidingimonas lacisalsi TaxID=2604086 RepID=UPI0011D23998|nr:sigma 54-interacting transcriptional regulator [Aidingimonas lacisalsi]
MSHIDAEVLKTIIETAHDHFFVVDGDGRVIDVSPGAVAVYGLSREELCQSTVYELAERGVLKPSVSLEVFRTGKPAQLMQQTATGRRVIAQAHPVYVNGRIERVVSRSMDLTDLQWLQDEYSLLQRRFSEHLKRTNAHSIGDDMALDSLDHKLQVRSQLMREIALLLKRVAPTDATVLMLGESGVGKTAFARQLHRWSERRDGPFIDVNCGAIPDSLFESEMFGYQPGAFSGAARQGKAGMLEQAHKGTLFLDEIGELPLPMQTKLLKVIQDGTLTRLGDTRSRRVDFRLVVATNHDLAGQVEQGAFRLDLYYRLNVIPVTLPPLRERREDIPGLAELQLKRLNDRYGQEKMLHSTVWAELMSHDWPGNVRELENWMERAWLSSAGDMIGGDAQVTLANGANRGILGEDAPLSAEAATAIDGGKTLRQAMQAYERGILARLCDRVPSTYAMAETLGISQPSVVRKLAKYGLSVSQRK